MKSIEHIFLFLILVLSIPAASSQEGVICVQVITAATGPYAECREFATPCDVPAGWESLKSSYCEGYKKHVKIEEFCDFQGPYCAQFYRETLPTLEQEYDIELVFRHFPWDFHEYAQKASEASECARNQGKFREYHNMLFENQEKLDVASLKKYASDLGLDGQVFESCLDSEEKRQKVLDDFEEGAKRGVAGTPTFFINSHKIVGAQPISIFKQTIIEEPIQEEPPQPEPEPIPPPEAEPVPAPEPGPSPELSYPDLQEEPVKGTGGILIEEYCSLQGPFCKRFYETTYQELWSEYGDKISFVFRNFPLSFHKNSFAAAEAGECALEQKGFWEMHDLLFERQDSWKGLNDPANLFVDYAKEIGLDGERFRNCLETGKYADEVKHDFEEGTKKGVTGTPTFFINGKKVVGAIPYYTFKQYLGGGDSITVTQTITQVEELPTQKITAEATIIQNPNLPQGYVESVPALSSAGGSRVVQSNKPDEGLIACKEGKCEPVTKISITKNGISVSTKGFSLRSSESEELSKIEIEVEIGGEKAIIEMDVEKGETKIITGRIEATTQEEVEVAGNILKVGGKNIFVSPSQAVENANAKSTAKVSIETGETPVYVIESTKNVRILGIIPVEIKEKTSVNAENGEVISKEQPWWIFLAVEEN